MEVAHRHRLALEPTGRIETLNTTGERVFGYAENDVRGKKLDLLIPSMTRRPRPKGRHVAGWPRTRG